MVAVPLATISIAAPASFSVVAICVAIVGATVPIVMSMIAIVILVVAVPVVASPVLPLVSELSLLYLLQHHCLLLD
jgi:hypothetical protein